MHERYPPDPQTIGSPHGYGHTFAGLCSNCKPVRDVIVSMPELIARVGPADLVRHALKRIVCRECGSRLDPHVATPTRSTYHYPEPCVGHPHPPRTDDSAASLKIAPGNHRTGLTQPL